MTPQEFLLMLGSVAGAISVTGGLLIKVWQTLITNPVKRWETELMDKSNKALKETLAPLAKQMEKLNSNLEESQRDRAAIHVELDEHEENLEHLTKELHEHDKRITILERRTI